MYGKTTLPKISEIKRSWHVIDAKGKVLGRLATQVAGILRGKDKAFFTPSIDCGDFVILTNAEKVKLTGKKLDQKINYRHSGYPGGDKYTPYKKLLETHPDKALHLAVKGMLPKNRLAAKQIKRLKIYKGENHPHSAQLAKNK